MLSPTAILEVRRLQKECETLLAQPNLSRSDSKKADLLIAQISAIKEAGVTDGEYQRMAADELGREIHAPEQRVKAAHEAVFRKFMRGVDVDVELRGNDLLAGSQSITYTEGSAGGVLVPQSFQNAVALGLAQVDPLLDPNVCSVIQEQGFALKPLTLPGWDLSAVKAVLVSEAAQHTSDTVPQVWQKMLNKWTYRLSLGASMEFEEDVFDSAMSRMGQAFGVGFARGIGADLILGDGNTAPDGVLNRAGNTGIVLTGGNNPSLPFYEGLIGLYFSVNRIYRQSPKCAWLMSDTAYKQVRLNTDSVGQPLLKVVDDRETLMGKPVYICPSLAASKKIAFGDFSYFYVHASTMILRRRLQVPGYVENGKALYTGLMSVDSILFDPTGGAAIPIQTALVSPSL